MPKEKKITVKQIGVKLNQEDYDLFKRIRENLLIKNDAEIVRVLIRHFAKGLPGGQS